MKAIALVSGGLDSTLAAKLIQNQGIEVIGLYFQIPFSISNKTLSDLGIEVRCVDIKEAFLEIVTNPRYGFGSKINPCIDCKILMLSKAKELMPELGARFIITGEVLGQRPMSQNRQSLYNITKRAEIEGLVVRPLSARLFPESIPEKEGWVNRNKLLDFSGRGRKPQIALAKKLGIQEYAQPAGGCLLTDPEFAKRLKDLINYHELNMNNIELLKIGRHFRLSKDAKLIVGRNEKENERLVNLAQRNDYLFMPADIAGPVALGRGVFNDDLIKLSSRVVCRYCDLDGKTIAQIVYNCIPEKEKKILEALPLWEIELKSLRI